MRRLKSKVILSFLAILLVFVFVVFLFLGKKKIEEYSITKKDSFYFYVDSEYMEFDGLASLNRDNNVTDLVMDNITLENITEPIYYKKQKKVIFPNSMSIIRPTLGMKQNKLTYYSTVEYNNPIYKISNLSTDIDIDRAFVYDGVNTYFFIDNVTIEAGDIKVDLPPFSYVRCGYKDYLYIYNYESKEMNVYDNLKDIVYAKTSDYTINLSTDNLTVGDSSIILVKNIDKLKNIE